MVPAIHVQRGFTRIELLVWGTFLALLALIIAPKFLDERRGPRRNPVVSAIANFKTALQLYQVDNGRYPTTAQGLDALIHQPANTPHWKKYLQDLNTIPLDRWGRPYVYQCPGPRGEPYLILSYGADGKPGGEGDDADITSVQGSDSEDTSEGR